MSTDQLIGQLREMHELREVFLRWFVASSRKDLDAQMAPIADDIVAYDHHAPHEHRGAEAVRTVRAEGRTYPYGLAATRLSMTPPSP